MAERLFNKTPTSVNLKNFTSESSLDNQLMQENLLKTFCFNIAIMKIKGKGSSKYQIPVNILNWAIK